MKFPLSHGERVPAKRAGEGMRRQRVRFSFSAASPPPSPSTTPSPSGRRFGCALLLPFLTLFSPAFADESVDLELVLAIDASSSVEEAEWQLQREGYASAFRDH